MQLKFSPKGFTDWQWWQKHNKKKSDKIEKLLDEMLLTPYTGTGKPEPLKHEFSGYWSRRIDRENRLIYKIENESLMVISCRFHYEK